jgi:excisionase family DNA binding protein
MNTQLNPPRMALSVSDFCRSYAIGRTTFYEEVKAGRLRVLKAGKRTLIASSDAERWLESLRKI